jgi:hypothetical protein
MGIEAGKLLFHGDSRGLWKLKLLSSFLFCYILGGFLGAFCYSPDAVQGVDFVGAEAQSLLVPAGTVFAIAAVWLVSLSFAEPSADGTGLHAEVRSTFGSTRSRTRCPSSDVEQTPESVFV